MTLGFIFDGEKFSEAIKAITKKSLTSFKLLALIETTRQTQRQSGRALLMVAQSTWQNEQLEVLDRDRALNRFNCLNFVVFGVVGNIAGLSETDTMLAFLHIKLILTH